MPKPLVQSEIEQRIRDYVTRGARPSRMTPILLTKESIMRGTGLNVNDVDEGLNALSGNQAFNEGKRVLERVPCSFTCWIPKTHEGRACKTMLYRERLAHFKPWLFTAVLFVIASLAIVFGIGKGHPDGKMLLLIFCGGVLMMASVAIGKAIANPLYLGWQRLAAVPHYRWWIALCAVSLLIMIGPFVLDIAIEKIAVPIGIIGNIVAIIGVLHGMWKTKTTTAKVASARGKRAGSRRH